MRRTWKWIARERVLREIRIAVSMLIALAGAWNAASSAVAQDDLPGLVRAARDQFTPISDEQLTAARGHLHKQAQSLERYLRPNSANGKRWLAYLKWDAFEKELLSEDKPVLAPLADTYRQLNRDEPGLELAPFRNFSNVLLNYINLAALEQQPDQGDAYGKQLDALASEIEKYQSQPTSNSAAAIGRRLDFVAGIGQNPELVSAIRTQLSQPNALITISTGLLRDAAADPINRRDPITDVILGTRIRGRGHTTGTVNLRTVPNDEMAVIALDTKGTVVSQNLGYNGPAVIRSTGTTNFNATQVVEFSNKQFRALPARVSARTGSRIHSVSKAGGGIGRNVVANVGMDKAREKQGQANRIAADHAEVRIARRMTDEVDERLRKAWKRYQDEYVNPLVRRGALPDHIRFSTTEDELAYEVTQATRAQLGAPGEPPSLPADRDMVARVHETAINNYTSAILGGATISETDPKVGTKADVSLPGFMKDAWKNRMDEKAEEAPADDFEPWTLTFRGDRPVTVSFADGQVRLTLHIAYLKSGDDVFDEGWDVTGTFKPEMVEGGVVLRREGDLEVLPTGFDPEKGRLASRQVAVRSNLTKVLTERSDKGRGYPQKIEVKKIEPTDDYADVGPLLVKDFNSGAGWLTVAWSRQ